MDTPIDLSQEIWHVCFNKLTLKLIHEVNLKLQQEQKPWVAMISAHGTTEQLFQRLLLAMEVVQYREGWAELHSKITSMQKEIQYCLNRFSFVAGRMEQPTYALPLQLAERTNFFDETNADKYQGVTEEVDKILLKYMRMGDYL